MEIDLNANFEVQYHETIEIRTKYLGADLEGLFFFPSNARWLSPVVY